MAFFNRDYQRIIQLHIESGWIPNIDNQQNMMNEIRAIGEPLYAKPLKDISFGNWGTTPNCKAVSNDRATSTDITTKDYF